MSVKAGAAETGGRLALSDVAERYSMEVIGTVPEGYL
jgi:hypothetical protein